MILYEYEGKNILSASTISVPKSALLASNDQSTMGPELDRLFGMTNGVVLKAQVLSGKRADAGGIMFVKEIKDLRLRIKDLFSKEINGEKVEKVLIEEKVDFEEEYYLSISYDTDYRAPVLSISQSGGTGIEERGVHIYPIDPITKTVILSNSSSVIPDGSLRHPERSSEGSLANASNDSDKLRDSSPVAQNDKGLVQDGIKEIPQDLIQKLVNIFFENDCLLLEINPLVKTKGNPSTRSSLRTDSSEGIWMALDAKIKLDDTASGRHKEEWNFPSRAVPGHTRTEREVEAKKIDEDDYRGTAGSTYFDLDGDIAILASGGGASITAMDALIKVGGKPANYTEYSGNPPKEKVEKLTKIVLSKPDLHGLWIVGALANFTDIYETLSGFMEGLNYAQKELGKKIDFPIVIRRAGPNDKKAFEMLKAQTKDFDLHLYGEETSISESAEVIAELAKKYANSLSSQTPMLSSETPVLSS